MWKMKGNSDISRGKKKKKGADISRGKKKKKGADISRGKKKGADEVTGRAKNKKTDESLGTRHESSGYALTARCPNNRPERVIVLDFPDPRNFDTSVGLDDWTLVMKFFFCVFLNSLRDAVSSDGQNWLHGIQRLTPLSSLTLKLNTWNSHDREDRNWLTMPIDITYLYIRGFVYDKQAYSVRGLDRSEKDLKLQTNQFNNIELDNDRKIKILGWGGSYCDMGDRTEVPIGLHQLVYSIQALKRKDFPSHLSKRFLVIVQTLCETARFFCFQDRILMDPNANLAISSSDATLQNNWVQACEGLALQGPKSFEGSKFGLNSVSDLALLKA